MNCIIIGLSNFGIELAQQLTDLGHEVLGIDADINKVNLYKDKIKNTICLKIDGEQAAQSLPLKDADVVFVTIRKDLGASVLIVATLKQAGAKRIIASSISGLHSTILQAMGITEIIQPEKEYADYFAQKIDIGSSSFSYKVADNYFIYEASLPASFTGRELKDIAFEKDFGMKLVAIKHLSFASGKSSGKYEIIEKPEENYTVAEKDIFILAGKKRNYIKLMKG
ncbi:TrkA family potassium uptake protein [Porphyromonadaceae bacterium OttesenSCG-928-L07]|nr:TrkA family potassium uptake protein [Porphyromonadaceae bacterium OttesenSCG-928-L07]MDL2251873.1 TrkA family potassium uptake protein [Odoribacter sp. OttesenSCG-928-J03]MDL2330562.1 TrkA family potassium uptake protein [Odoribacter sp. OttesenSCG-928-A06]